MSNNSRSDLHSLLTRVEAATGPDKELDVSIFGALQMPLPTKFANLGISLKWVDGVAVMPVGDMQVRYYPPAYTSSLDAALALVEEMLPGWSWGIHRHATTRGSYRAQVTDLSPIRPMPNIADGSTPPLAVLSALLRALIAKQEGADAEG